MNQIFDNCPRCNSRKVVTRREILDDKVVTYTFECKMCSFSILSLSISKEKDKIKRDIERLSKRIKKTGDIRLLNIMEKRIARYGGHRL